MLIFYFFEQTLQKLSSVLYIDLKPNLNLLLFQRRKMQVLKDEVRNKILFAAEKIFYEKDFRGTKLTDIADEADIPVALIYTYFKNKADLFDAVVAGVDEHFTGALEKEEALEAGLPSTRFEKVGAEYVHDLLKNHEKLVILMDKSTGTKHEGAKDRWIERLQSHIEKGAVQFALGTYDSTLFHILSNNYVEGLLEIARHYKNDEWAQEMLALMNRCYYHGVESL